MSVAVFDAIIRPLASFSQHWVTEPSADDSLPQMELYEIDDEVQIEDSRRTTLP